MADDQSAASIIPKPDKPAITWQGKEITPKRVVDAWCSNAEIMKPFHDEVRRAGNFRRGKLVRKIAPTWAAKHPEAAAAAQARLPQRRTLEQDLKARLGVVQPNYIRKALGDTERDGILAQESEDYLNEWATSPFGVPYPVFLDKGCEDGGYLRVRLPAMADMEGRPDFFDRLSERAYAAASDDEKASYKKDPKGRQRKPYLKVDAGGNPVPAKRYAAMMAEPDEDKNLPPLKRSDRAKQRSDKAKAEHDKAIQRYLLQRPASTAQVFGGLDVVPIFKRGTGREQAVLAAAVTRQLVTVEEALEAQYGWTGMNGRLLVPRGDSDTNTVGKNGAYYLYTMFLTSTDDDGIEHPILVYTLGGKGTTYQMGGAEPDSRDQVGFLDLYDEYGIEGPLWSWHWGLKTRDDEPSYRGRPYISDLIDLMLAIEGEEMAIRATTQVIAFTGHVQELGDALKGPNPEAAIEAASEAGPNGTKNLKKPVIPSPGEAVSSVGTLRPFQQAQIGQDAWRNLASDRQALAEATAVDQSASSPGASGHAIVVGETLAKVAKRDIRDEALEAFRRDGEDHFKILAAIEAEHHICWPIQKVEEPPAGDVTQDADHYTVAEFSPDWIGDEGQFSRLAAEFPDEENLAALDLEAGLADRGYSHFENVVAKKGITDPEREWQKVLKWKMRQNPLYLEVIMKRLATRRGDQAMIDVLKQLQAKQQITEAGVPGASNGVPTSALRRIGQAGPQQQGSGGQTAVSASRGGQMAGEMGTAAQNHDSQAVAQVSQGAA